MSKVSIIVPVYKVEQYLNRCVDSILNQTYKDFELVLVDDGSPDNCPKMCDEYALKDSRVKVIHKQNGGQGEARNLAIKQSQGDWATFVDSDDMIKSTMLEKLYKVAEKTKSQIVCCDVLEAEKVTDEFYKNAKYNITTNFVSEKFLIDVRQEKYIYWIVCSKLIKSNILKQNLFTVGKIYEDNAIVPKWLYLAKNISIVDEKLYFYQINKNSTTKKTFSIKHLDYLWSFREKIKFFDSIKYATLSKIEFDDYWNTLLCYYKKTKKEISKEQAKKILFEFNEFIKVTNRKKGLRFYVKIVFDFEILKKLRNIIRS